jgi:hypothetical protein
MVARPERPFAHLSDAELEALPYDELDIRARIQICLETLARQGVIHDTGEVRKGQTVW